MRPIIRTTARNNVVLICTSVAREQRIITRRQTTTDSKNDTSVTPQQPVPRLEVRSLAKNIFFAIGFFMALVKLVSALCWS